MKKNVMIGMVIALTFVVCANAYAGGDGAACPVNDFFHGVGDFLYNALPWNWHNWAGK